MTGTVPTGLDTIRRPQRDLATVLPMMFELRPTQGS